MSTTTKAKKPLFIVTEKNGKTFITTPALETGFVAVSKPSDKFDKDGKYSVKMRVKADSPEGREMVELFDRLHEEAIEYFKEEKGKKKIKVAGPPYYEEENDDGEPTGYFLFNATSKVRGKNKKGEQFTIPAPALFDAKGKPIDRNRVNIGGGSVLKIFVEVNPYFHPKDGVAVSFRLKAVKVIKLVEFSSGAITAEAAGFAEEEEGFYYDPDQFQESDGEDMDIDSEEEEEDDEGEDDEDEADF